MEFETIKFLGEDFKRETFESLVKRKATPEEFGWSGFIQIQEQPDRLSPEGANNSVSDSQDQANK